MEFLEENSHAESVKNVKTAGKNHSNNTLSKWNRLVEKMREKNKEVKTEFVLLGSDVFPMDSGEKKEFRFIEPGSTESSKDNKSTEISKEKMSKEDSDYIRESTETNSSGGSSSTSGDTQGKVRRVHRAVRNKTRGVGEVRRNPIRVRKKNPDKSFPRPRQRLLSAKRKGGLGELEPNKKSRLSTMPYMNTRSVTRKMYNVGATYQAPTTRDETEWKEWPVHGMHERPVFHPQVGLAAEYLGKYFTSFDGLSYREIVEHPEIEVVSVDPRSEIQPSSIEKKRNRKTKPNEDHPIQSRNNRLLFSEENKSFDTCMHGSFHCVLGYCSQVLSPVYKSYLERRTSRLSQEDNESKVETKMNDSSIEMKFEIEKDLIGNRPLDGYPVSVSRNFTYSKPITKPVPRLYPMQTMYVAASQKNVPFTKNLESGQIKVQELIRPSPKNPLILVSAPDGKATVPVRGRILKPMSNFEFVKLDNKTLGNEDTCTETTSGYKTVNSNATESLNENLANRGMNLKNITVKQGMKSNGITLTKYHFDIVQEGKMDVKQLNPATSFQLVLNENECKEQSGKLFNCETPDSGKNSSITDASEIARILSEYNKNTGKTNAENSMVKNQVLQAYHLPSSTMKDESRVNDENVLEHPKTSRQNLSIQFPQGKWRRFHFTVEKMKPATSVSNDEKKPSKSQNEQLIYKQESLETTSSCSTIQSGGESCSIESRPATKKMVESKEPLKTHSLQELLENTAVLYCAATGAHQEDLASYVDTLDTKQSIQWLQDWSNTNI